MSELKAFTFGLGQYTEDGSPCVVAFDGEKNPRLASDEKFYLKSEADKVFAEKDAEIERLEILCATYRHDCDNLAISNEQAKRAARTLLKKMNYNKYKRCLAMARWGNERHTFNDTNEKRTWLHKGHNRWLELAEKFKPNSTAQ